VQVLPIYFDSNQADFLNYRFAVVSTEGELLLNNCIRRYERFMEEQASFFLDFFKTIAIYVIETYPHLVITEEEFKDTKGVSGVGLLFERRNTVNIQGTPSVVIGAVNIKTEKDKEFIRGMRIRLYTIMKDRLYKFMSWELHKSGMIKGFVQGMVNGKLVQPILILAERITIIGVPVSIDISEKERMVLKLIGPSDVRDILKDPEVHTIKDRPILVMGDWGFSSIRINKDNKKNV